MAAVSTRGQRHRQPVKAQGRTAAVDVLRTRCLARIREDRESLLNRLRHLDDTPGGVVNLREMAHDLVRSEMLPDDRGTASAFQMHCLAVAEVDGAPWHHPQQACSEELNEDELLALEDAILAELQHEAELEAIQQAEWFYDLQNAEDCELYEQHMLGGIPCPLCNSGRLEVPVGTGELRCSSCQEMRAALMDEALPLDDVAEMLCMAETRHRESGCKAHAAFEVRHDLGQPLLFLRCSGCGWDEIVL